MGTGKRTAIRSFGSYILLFNDDIATVLNYAACTLVLAKGTCLLNYIISLSWISVLCVENRLYCFLAYRIVPSYEFIQKVASLYECAHTMRRPLLIFDFFIFVFFVDFRNIIQQRHIFQAIGGFLYRACSIFQIQPAFTFRYRTFVHTSVQNFFP